MLKPIFHALYTKEDDVVSVAASKVKIDDTRHRENYTGSLTSPLCNYYFFAIYVLGKMSLYECTLLPSY